ncbi:tripartite tricarboxylate transporter substrate binding protein [Roseiarcaceae bacterium H3SJ34-1]|uniref:Bug family tripartite tricarboxylate transporter substrate binding protein n=1 Tax=Terripilifer ovatus TaxID=3032367 RepID=UPI003AB9A816|nr:tripartite tricarboxylate transporter substrate binding protein [Roseiarcaceae bacterium H3SJ34-1]
MISRRQFVGGAAGLAAAGSAPLAFAQAYPSRPVRFLLGYAAGSGPDLIARFYAERLRPLMKTIVVENKPGAGGNIAAEQVARAKPDGYTLHPTGGGSLAAAPVIYREVPFDVERDLVVVAMLARQHTLLVVGANSPAKDMNELSAILKAKGDKGRWGSAIPTARVLGTLYSQSIGVAPVEVQYKTSADWIPDLANDMLDFAFIDSASGLGHARQGRIRALAGSSATRISALPDIPTMKSFGVDVDMASWWAVYAPAATPEPLQDQINQWFNEQSATPEAKAFLNGIGNEPWPLPRREAEAYHLEEVKNWARYVKIAGIQPQG